MLPDPPPSCTCEQQIPVLMHDIVPRDFLHLNPEARLKPTVHIFGLQKSGTNALWGYLTRFFGVNVQPTRATSGMLSAPPRWQGWKRHVPVAPCEPYLLPTRTPPGAGGSENVVLIMVRDVRSPRINLSCLQTLRAVCPPTYRSFTVAVTTVHSVQLQFVYNSTHVYAMSGAGLRQSLKVLTNCTLPLTLAFGVVAKVGGIG